MATFVPRRVYPHLDSIPRSYYLGHHAAGLTKMKSLINQIDLVIECRDYRTPLVSRNPLFEETLGERPRLIVYTKQDLGSKYTTADQAREEIIRQWDRPSSAMFTDVKDRKAVRQVLQFAKDHAAASNHLVGSRMMVVGMPNVGKSSLLNALRNVGLGLKKAARTGDQPGITRKIASGVKIVEKDGQSEGVYLLDTPGVFVPYVPDAESMLKLALCGNVKDTVIPPTTTADYLLFHLNLRDPSFYNMFSEPSNDVHQVLDGLAKKQGRLKKGGLPDIEAAALQFIQRWRAGGMGRFVLDEVAEDALDRRKDSLEGFGRSMHQARKAFKEARRHAAVEAN